MKTSLLFLLAAFLGARTIYSQPLNTTISETTLFDGEPYLAINPVIPENMVIAWMSYVKNPGIPLLEQIGIRTKASTDGGKTWGNENIMPHASPRFHSADVSMAYNHETRLYIAYIDYAQDPDSGGIFVAHSGDNGISWSDPVKAFDLYDNDDRPIDRPWIAVDNSLTSSDGTIYITTKPAPWDPIPNRPYMKYSTDGGNTWSRIDTVDGGNYLAGPIDQPMVSPAVGNDGIFRAAYISWDIAQYPTPRYTLASSTDHGTTYSRSTISIPLTSAGKDTLSKLGYHLAVNPEDPLNMIFVWPDSRDGDLDVYATVTFDGGQSWGAAKRINDDPKNNGVWQDLIWATFSTGGRCVISWRDRRNGDSTGYQKGSDIYFATSLDAGRTFGKNMRVSDRTAPFSAVLNGAGNDFQSTAIADDSLCLTWGDVRTGKLTIYFAKAALATGGARVTSVTENSGLLLFPNPATDFVSAIPSGANSGETNISIYDVLGKEVAASHTTGLSGGPVVVSLENLPAGSYHVIVTAGQEIYSKQLTILK